MNIFAMLVMHAACQIIEKTLPVFSALNLYF